MAAYTVEEVDGAIKGLTAQKDQKLAEANFFIGQIAAYEEIKKRMLAPEEKAESATEWPAEVAVDAGPIVEALKEEQPRIPRKRQ